MTKLPIVYKLYNKEKKLYYVKGGRWNTLGHVFKRKCDLSQSLSYFETHELKDVEVETYMLAPKNSVPAGRYIYGPDV